MGNISNISVAYGDRIIFNNGDSLLRPGDKVGLVGPQGAGSTDPGTVICYFSQQVGEMSDRSALEEVLAGAGLTDAQMEFQRGNGYELESRAHAILGGLGISKDRHLKRLQATKESGQQKCARLPSNKMPK